MYATDDWRSRYQWATSWKRACLSTETADRPQAEAAVRQLYQQAGYRPPERIIWCDGPTSMLLVATLSRQRKPTGKLLTAEKMQEKLVLTARQHTQSAIGLAALDRAAQHVGGRIRRSLRRVLEEIHTMIWANAKRNIQRPASRRKVWRAVQRALPGEVAPVEEAPRALIRLRHLWAQTHRGQFDAPSWATYAYLSDQVKLRRATAPLTSLLTLAQSAGPFLTFERVCFISERLAALHRDSRERFHADDQPALAFRDGVRRSYIGGVRVPNWLVEKPDRLTVERIDAQRNAEVRRIMLERYGLDRFLMDGGAELIHEDHVGRLYRRAIPEAEPLVMVRLVNSTQEPDGTYKEYFLRVPPTMTTARQAVAWTFGLEWYDYHPFIET